ncbi:hypothetical protein PF010_g29697 [Phytophthora fragariae]|uniref:Uncharacterized protein n=1 Tax=Phytophthora fragariae TaxID=53985 RepID=A0A6A4B864_9STRA|nr:hypothetical protein PF003_g35902 [Phytophthora fragariae]KAE8919308.1 hypothetical protein PF009_g30385 [Phytophthora fragariae]KAE9061754.1 hypothetical protein PF010_g29697 [Phytophthora fragariae]KAE9062694.1 hypothetical protein PF007_g29823 [Phytophthora fragariae]KAE9068474.1 hypothetical protein PF006_g29780 [Phytophthora fragariae]
MRLVWAQRAPALLELLEPPQLPELLVRPEPFPLRQPLLLLRPSLLLPPFLPLPPFLLLERSLLSPQQEPFQPLAQPPLLLALCLVSRTAAIFAWKKRVRPNMSEYVVRWTPNVCRQVCTNAVQ